MTDKRNKLIFTLRNIPNNMKEKLEELKSEQKQIERLDFLWHYTLQSFSTMGDSKGHAGLILNKENYNQVTYQAVEGLLPMERFNRFNNILNRAGVVDAEKKAKWLCFNFEYINSMGGLEETRKILFNKVGKESKIEFLKTFKGIGDKYARNIFMDVYHPDFHNCIAIDYRINKITEAMGYSFDNYSEHEKFYLEIAKECGLNGWELDRLLYNYNKYFLKILS